MMPRTFSLVLVAWLSLIISIASGQNLNPSDANNMFDPNDPGTVNDCNLPPYQHTTNYIMPADGLCTDTSGKNFTAEQIQAVALKYAPVLFFHPSEQYTMATVDSIFADPEGGKVFDGTQLVDGLDILSLPDVGATNTWIKPENTDGMGFGEDGKSPAAIYYNYVDAGNSTWAFNYYMFYPYGGSVDMAFTTTNEEDPPLMYFNLSPFGEHEGDWETISVLVCASDIEAASQPLAVHYFHRTYSWLTDCTKGECNLFKEAPTHPVGFVAHSHHSTYPFPSKQHFIGNIDLAISDAVPLEGMFWTVDSTTAFQTDKVDMFMPDDTNVIWHDLSVNDYFAFGGRWGQAGNFDALVPSDPVCLDEEQLIETTCPPNKLLITVVGLFEDFGDQAAAFLPPELVPIVVERSYGSHGPQFMPNYNEWIAPRNPQIYQSVDPGQSTEDFCNALPKATYGEAKGSAVEDETVAPVPESEGDTSGVLNLNHMVSVVWSGLILMSGFSWLL